MLRLTESAQNQDETTLGRKWARTASGSYPSVEAASGRRGTGAIKMNWNGARLQRTFDDQATWIVGFALEVDALPTSTYAFATWLDGGTEQCSLRMTSGGALTINRGGTVLGTTPWTVTLGASVYVEAKVTIDDAGSYEIRVDEVTQLSGSGDTQVSANAYANAFRLGVSAGSTSTWEFHDLYLCDGSGTFDNDFLGDCRADSYLADGDGFHTDWTPLGAGTHSVEVDEAVPDDDASYLETGTATDRFSLTFDDMTHDPSAIFGVVIQWIGKKSDAGGRSFEPSVRRGATDYDGTAQGLSTSYGLYEEIFEKDPSTAAAWTKANVNAGEYGGEAI